MFHVTPLAAAHQFCIIHRNITIFSGGKLFVPFCRPDPSVEIPKQPAFVTVTLPDWLSVHGGSNQSSGFVMSVSSTATLPGSRLRITFQAATSPGRLFVILKNIKKNKEKKEVVGEKDTKKRGTYRYLLVSCRFFSFLVYLLALYLLARSYSAISFYVI